MIFLKFAYGSEHRKRYTNKKAEDTSYKDFHRRMAVHLLYALKISKPTIAENLGYFIDTLCLNAVCTPYTECIPYHDHKKCKRKDKNV